MWFPPSALMVWGRNMIPPPPRPLWCEGGYDMFPRLTSCSDKEIFLESCSINTIFGLYLNFSDGFGSKRNSFWCQINLKSVFIIVIKNIRIYTLFRLIFLQTKFCMMPNLSEKFIYNPSLAWFRCFSVCILYIFTF